MGQNNMAWTSVVNRPTEQEDFVNFLPKLKGPFPNDVLDVYLRP